MVSILIVLPVLDGAGDLELASLKRNLIVVPCRLAS
jgi:hypothetical protein